MNKCTAKNGGYSATQCGALKHAVSYGVHGRSKGLFAGSIIDLKTEESLGTAIIIKSEAIPKGLYLNFCPFCGGELRDISK